ncbi:(Fe-S)-binding protein [Desulforhopalus vacuolatus]|uniref:(Fe-S)-binding protein n=1 Tax=Desulforhopalus vacuolatus TaxID=40414 RepID=UPI0019647A9B|nr:(Fe-S)-binding protein [Desulforhopalus vacuolatus]MBM9518940.1 (Fe-S)-binding protein [Desulforhopalus vacuolatus]
MNKPEKVTLFIQCLVDTVFPETGAAMVTVLERLGLKLDCPSNQTCCGQPAFNAGHQREARAAAVKFLDIFEDAEVIVCPSGSCVNMVRNHYLELFADDPKMLVRAQAVSMKIYEFTEFLVDVLGVESVGARFPHKVTYHASCHLNRFLGVDRQPRTLLAHIDDMTLIEMKDADTCCGFGGTFAVKYSEISGAVLEEKVQNIVDSGAEVVTGCDMGCLMNIQGMLSRKNIPIEVKHIAQLLAEK